MGLFENLLRRQAEERHARICGEAWRARREPVRDLGNGFLPPSEAAKVMGVTEAELRVMVGRGLLEHDDLGHVRPAVVSILAVRDSAA